MSTPLFLIMRVGALWCALPLGQVVETTRLLPVTRLASAPPFVTGISLIRGEPLPVVNLAFLLGAAAYTPARFVVVRAAERKLVLAVDAVVGVHPLALETLTTVPPLLVDAQAEIVTTIGALDKELLLVLETARIVPGELWSSLGELEEG